MQCQRGLAGFCAVIGAMGTAVGHLRVCKKYNASCGCVENEWAVKVNDVASAMPE